ALDLAGLDLAGGDGQRVEEAEAGVGDVENLRGGGQADLAVREGRGGRLEHVAADGAMDEEFNLFGAQSGFGERGATGGGGGVGRTRAGGPDATLADAGHQL